MRITQAHLLGIVEPHEFGGKGDDAFQHGRVR